MRKQKKTQDQIEHENLLDLQDLREAAAGGAGMNLIEVRKYQTAIDNIFYDDSEFIKKKKAAENRRKRRRTR